jgi:hypothetical protein
MAETASAHVSGISKYKGCPAETDVGYITVLKEQYKCPHFRVLIMGRANAGKTTILEKVCGVESGTEPIIYDQNGE